MDKYMKKSDVIAYIRNEAKEAQSAFEELGGESGIIAEAFEDLANELEDCPAASVPQWISVKDRLPDDNDRVIAFRQYEAEVSAYRYCVKWGWSLKTSMSYNGITHWMPLSEPSKGENDG